MQGILAFSSSWRDPCPGLKRASALLLVVLLLEAAAILTSRQWGLQPLYILPLLRLVDLSILLVWGPWDFSTRRIKTGLQTAVLVAVVLGLAGAIFLLSWGKYFGSPLFGVTTSVRHLSGFPFAAFLLTSCLLAPFAEELVFRGILYRLARERWPVWLCTAAVSLLFAALHLGAIQRFLTAYLGSVIFCLVYERTRSILTPILVHVTGNLLIYLFPLV